MYSFTICYSKLMRNKKGTIINASPGEPLDIDFEHRADAVARFNNHETISISEVSRRENQEYYYREIWEGVFITAQIFVRKKGSEHALRRSKNPKAETQSVDQSQTDSE